MRNNIAPLFRKDGYLTNSSIDKEEMFNPLLISIFHNDDGSQDSQSTDLENCHW